MFRGLILSFVASVLASTVWASSPSIEFSWQEKRIHENYVDFVTQKAAQCLEETWKEHKRFHALHGVSKFYGDRNKSLNTPAKRIAALAAAGAPVSLEPQLEATSCIGLARKCFAKAFNATKNREAIALWSRIDHFVKANGVGGIPLIHALQGLGWTVMYWNPQPSQNLVWDDEDVQLLKGWPVDFNSGVTDERGRFIYHSGWGAHEVRYNSVMNRNTYYKTTVDDKYTLVDFGTSVPDILQQVPFFVGVAHTGYHVFPGYSGRVVEAHSTRKLTSIDNMENSFFNPLASGGGPRWSNTERYRSGLIAVPPRSVW